MAYARKWRIISAKTRAVAYLSWRACQSRPRWECKPRHEWAWLQQLFSLEQLLVWMLDSTGKVRCVESDEHDLYRACK